MANTSIVARFLGRWGYTRQEAKAQEGGGVRLLFAGEAPPGQYNWEGLTDVQKERLAITSSWVYSDVQELSRLACQSKLEVHRREGEETQAEYDHEFEQVLRYPNPYMGRNFVMQYTFGWWLLRGEAYWMLAEDNAGELAQVYPLPASRMSPIPDPDRYISGYRYYPLYGGQPKTFSVEQVFFLRFPNIFDYHRGLSPLTAFDLALRTDISAERWNLGTFTKEVAVRTMFVVSEQGGRFNAAAEKIEEDLLKKELRYMIVPADHVDVKEFGLKHKDIEFLATTDLSRERIDRAFGFPKGYWSEKANRANAEQAVATVINGAVWPLLELFAEELTSQVVIPRYGSDYLVLPSDIRPEDRRLLVAERKTYWPVVKLNEARAELKRDDYDGPLADVLGELPVSLATDPQFVMAYALGVSSPTAVKAGGNGGGRREALEDLRRWRGIERRRFKEGERPGTYDFVSEWLPAGVVTEVKAALVGADSEEVINQVFDGVDLGALPAGAEGGAVDRELVELALRSGMPGQYLWPRLGSELGLTEAQVGEMTELGLAEPGRPWWEPERELEGK